VYWGISKGGWSETDRLLTAALKLHEQSKCSNGCGHYTDEAWDDDADGWYEADDSTVCHACAARERWQRDHQDGTARPEPGQLLRVVDTRHEDV